VVVAVADLQQVLEIQKAEVLARLVDIGLAL
jgi:hypothetical protein